ncbi:MAG: peptidoglycan-binding protein, partial [Gammaproteobacteria bacterium]
ALAGDRLIRQEIEIPLNFFPKPPDTPIDGRIISVVDGISLIGQYQVIVINRGARNGLAPGDVLRVLTAGETVRDRYRKIDGHGYFGRGEKVKLPDEPAGTVMLFKVYDRIAYALVMEAESEMRVHDIVRNPS